MKINSNNISDVNIYRVSDIVNRKEYHDKFEKVMVPKQTQEALYKYAIEILKERNGTAMETAFALDIRLGKLIERTHTNVEFKSALTLEEMDKINSSKSDVFFIHNHPCGGRLSLGDLKTLYKNRIVKGMMAVGHNGDVYYCQKNNKISVDDIEEAYTNAYNKLINKGFDKQTVLTHALDEVYDKLDICLVNC